jgi:hypothetical protein
MRFTQARKAMVEVDRAGNVPFHSELVLAIAIAAFRRGDHATALTHLEVLRRAPMFGAVFYDLRRDFASRGRRQLDDQAASEAQSTALGLASETILDKKLRITSRRPSQASTMNEQDIPDVPIDATHERVRNSRRERTELTDQAHESTGVARTVTCRSRPPSARYPPERACRG